MIQQTASRRQINAFTVDVEDYFQVSGFEDVVPRDTWENFESRIHANTHRFLEMLNEYKVRATFFVLGWVADKYPKLVREIADLGHEIGCHSQWHHLIYDQNREEFREDLHQSTCQIEDAIGQKIDTYRAPSFSIVDRTLWALDELIERGYLYDSSIFPSSRSRCGIATSNRFPYRHQTESGSILEFPLTVHPVGGRKIPVGGGGYFRLFPIALTTHFLRQINERENQPFVFYIHPWEIDVLQPRIKNASRRAKLRHYLNLGKTERRLRRLLTEFRFGTLSESFASVNLTPDAGTVWAEPEPQETRSPVALDSNF